MKTIDEAWLPIPSAPDYEASTLGRIRGPRGLMEGTVHPTHGYVVHTIRRGGRRQWRAHTLVCEAFHGPAPEGKAQVAHWDGDRTNNRPENLRWASVSENLLDKRRHGTARTNVRLSDEDREAIRSLHGPPRGRGARNRGVTQGQLAVRYGVTQAHISRIVKGQA